MNSCLLGKGSGAFVMRARQRRLCRPAQYPNVVSCVLESIIRAYGLRRQSENNGESQRRSTYGINSLHNVLRRMISWSKFTRWLRSPSSGYPEAKLLVLIRNIAQQKTGPACRIEMVSLCEVKRWRTMNIGSKIIIMKSRGLRVGTTHNIMGPFWVN